MTSGAPRPGRTSSVVPLPGCIALLVLLAWSSDSQRVGWDVLGDHRTGCDPCSVTHLQRRDEAIVDAGPDVAADRGARLGPAGLVREVGRDRSGADIRVV